MSATPRPSLVQTCLVLVCVVCLLLPNDVTGSPLALANEKRGSARKRPRPRYRMGYMYGKRDSPMLTSSSLFDLISSRLITQRDLAALIEGNHDLASQVVSYLDKNDDGYITVTDFL